MRCLPVIGIVLSATTASAQEAQPCFDCANMQLKAELQMAADAPTPSDRVVFGEYRVSEEWSTSTGMDAQDEPVCRAMAQAANRSRASKPLAPYHEPPLKGAGVVEASWQPVTGADPIEIVKELARQFEAHFGRDLPPFSGDWVEDWKNKLATGKARLEWTTLVGFRGDARATRVLRLMDDPTGAERAVVFKPTKMAIVDGEGFTRLRYFYTLYPFDSAFTFQGRSYLFGISYREFDNSSTIHFAEPQQEIWIGESYEGPGVRLGEVAMLAICRLLYHKPKAKSP
jgi:hypothetical protein